MKSAEDIANLYISRKEQRSGILRRMEMVRTTYNGDLVVPLPELDREEKPAVANLVVQGIDQMAMRIASVMPDISYPALRPGFQGSEDKARNRRLANLAWWDMNEMTLIMRQRARFLLAYGCSPVTLSAVSPKVSDKRQIPFWRPRNPFSAYLPEPETLNDMEPADAIFCHRHTRGWLEDRYPDAMRRLSKGETGPNDHFEVIEYMDATEFVLVVMGQVGNDSPKGLRDVYGRPIKSNPGSPNETLVRVPNAAGIPLVVAPGRIVLDRLMGMFDQLPGMYHRQAKLDALELVSISRSIFPTEWLVTHPGSMQEASIVTEATGIRGIVGSIKGGQIQPITLQPSIQVGQAVDRLEREQRVTAGIPAEFGGESPTNIRTARRGQAVMASTITMPIGESQDVFTASMELENARGIAVMRAHHKGKSFSFYQSRTGPSPDGNDYNLTRDFETDLQFVKYSIPGADAAAIPIEIGQRVGTGEMSLQTAREMDPVIEDPILERDRVEVEGLRKAILTGLEQQAAQGAINPVVIAMIAKAKMGKDHPPIEDVLVMVHKEQQAQQQSQQGTAQPPPPGIGPPGAPPVAAPQPGAPPPTPAGTTIPPPSLSETHLRKTLRTLRSPVALAPAEAALGQ